MRLLFSPVLAAVILIGGTTVVLPQVVVRQAVPQVLVPQVLVPQVLAPQLVFPQVVMPDVLVPYPVFGGFYEQRRDVYRYGHRGYESREEAHHRERGGRGERR